MKKYFLNAVCLCLCAGFVFTSCKKDDDGPGTSSIEDNKITATVSASNVDNVKALVDVSGDNMGNLTGTSVANSSFSNGFTLTLPATVDAKYLEEFDDDDFPSGISVSDKSAKTGEIVIVGYDKAGAQLGTFWYASNTWDAGFIYADKNVTITGSGTDKYGDTEVYNVSLVKGWNIIYGTETEKNDVSTYTYTTSDPGGLKWVFDDYSDYSYQSASVSKSKIAGSKKLMAKGLK